MSKSFEVVFSRPVIQSITMQISASNQDEAKQKAWEAMLVDEHEHRLPWRQVGKAGDVSLEAARAAA